MVRSLAYQVAHVQAHQPASRLENATTPSALQNSACAVDTFQSGASGLRTAPQVADPTGWAQLQARFSSLRDSGVIR